MEDRTQAERHRSMAEAIEKLKPEIREVMRSVKVGAADNSPANLPAAPKGYGSGLDLPMPSMPELPEGVAIGEGGGRFRKPDLPTPKAGNELERDIQGAVRSLRGEIGSGNHIGGAQDVPNDPAAQTKMFNESRHKLDKIAPDRQRQDRDIRR